MTDFQDNTSEIDVDGILESIESTGSAPSEPKAAPEAAAPAPTQAVQEFEYDWRGQKIKEPLETILKRAGMGRDYNHLVEEHVKAKTQWEKERTDWDGKIRPYREIDDFIKTDPNGGPWWEHVQKSWQQRQEQVSDPNIKPIVDELNQVKSTLSEWQQERLQQQVTKEDAEFNAETQGIREKYPDLPWEVPGSDGKSLMFKVLEHGHTNGIKSFKTAFLDFYHDELQKRAESRGREAVVKDTQRKTKLGLLGETQAPQKGLSSAQNIKNRSYDDLTREALEELGIS